jgi:hypothetical protein
MDAMPPFANDQYGGGYPPPQQGGFGAPPPQQGGFGGQPAYGAPGGPGGFGAPPPQQGFGTDPSAGYGQPFPDPNAQYGGGGFGQQQAGFGAPPPQQGGFPGGQYAPPPPPQQGFGAPPPQQGFGQPGGFPPAQQGGFPGPAPGAAPELAPAPALPPNALRGFLVSYQSNTQGEFWALNGGRKTIGRANSGEQVDIPLSDATISSRHAALVVDGVAGTVQIEDTGSTNGTFVNEEHIGFNGKRDLRDGDKIRFGGYTTIVKVISRV